MSSCCDPRARTVRLGAPLRARGGVLARAVPFGMNHPCKVRA